MRCRGLQIDSTDMCQPLNLAKCPVSLIRDFRRTELSMMFQQSRKQYWLVGDLIVKPCQRVKVFFKGKVRVWRNHIQIEVNIPHGIPKLVKLDWRSTFAN